MLKSYQIGQVLRELCMRKVSKNQKYRRVQKTEMHNRVYTDVEELPRTIKIWDCIQIIWRCLEIANDFHCCGNNIWKLVLRFWQRQLCRCCTKESEQIFGESLPD